MAIQVTIAPSAEPVSLALAKLHLRVDQSDEDALIAGLITAARQYCERWCRRTFPTATLKLTLDRFPVGVTPIRLPYPPLVSVSAITYVDTDGATQALPAANYAVDNQSEPGRVAPAYTLIWPTTRLYVNSVAITYVAGSAAVPETVKQAMLLLIGHWYANREGVVTGTIGTTLDLAVEALLWSERIEV